MSQRAQDGPVAAVGALDVPFSSRGILSGHTYVPQSLPTPPMWRAPMVDIVDLAAAEDGASRLAAAIKSAPDGVLVLRNALQAPFAAIGDLFSRVTVERAARANATYRAGSSRLVWKDAHGEGRGGPHVDLKRVIDLSPHRIKSLASADPALACELGPPLADVLHFFEAARGVYGPLLVEALRKATGYDFTEDEARYAFRLVDYGSRRLEAGVDAPPRCSAHRDFGPATIIWPGGDDSSGLEIRVRGAWQRLPPLSPGSAVLLFGLCTAWRSNDRITAAEHRVSDDPALLAGLGGVSPRRLSAVLFMGLCDSAVLAPALVEPDEAAVYRTKLVGEVQPTVRRKWSWREGSVTAEEAAAEVEERSRFDSQGALVTALYKL